jgi:hypothetical protein
MRLLHRNLFLSVMLAGLSHSAVTAAQPAPLKPPTLVQAERRAIDLKQGMTLEDVENLLGKPKRTALRSQGYGSSAELAQGSLQWTYTWANPSQADRSLQVVFASKSPGQWFVSSWDWAGY